MASEDKDSDTRKSMQESWVEVKPQQQEGTLTHSHSLEQVEELLASAVSDKEDGAEQVPEHQEPTTLTSPTLFEVRFEPTPAEEELPTDEEPAEEAKAIVHVQVPVTQPLIVDDGKKGSPPPRPRSNRRRVLFLLVPVLLLTHLAFFGVGYYLGRRFSVETVTTVFHV